MSTDKKPDVFSNASKQVPKQEKETIVTKELDLNKHVETSEDYEKKKMDVANGVYANSDENLSDSVELMKKRTEEQLKLRNEMLLKNESDTKSYHEKYLEAQTRHLKPEQPKQEIVIPKSIRKDVEIIEDEENEDDAAKRRHLEFVRELSQPQYNAAFDLVRLPSGGKVYKGIKPNVKMAYLTTADENILTSPNLLRSGEFLEILINRKLLETGIRYKDLVVGDRNALMIWLRATSYGEMYPASIYDEDGNSFETEIDLTKLKMIHLNVEPDSDGHFDFITPLSNNTIKFKLLTIRDVEHIEALMDEDDKKELLVNKASTYKLQHHIVSVDGNTNKNYINEFIENMRISDSQKLKKYIESIDCGMDLQIEVKTPRGGSVKTFLPLDFRFFWPDYAI